MNFFENSSNGYPNRFLPGRSSKKCLQQTQEVLHSNFKELPSSSFYSQTFLKVSTWSYEVLLVELWAEVFLQMLGLGVSLENLSGVKFAALNYIYKLLSEGWRGMNRSKRLDCAETLSQKISSNVKNIDSGILWRHSYHPYA